MSTLKYKATERFSFGWTDPRVLSALRQDRHCLEGLMGKETCFRITNGVGFQLVFANGWMLSVQFGDGHYCANRNIDSLIARAAKEPPPKREKYYASPDAECAIVNSEGGLIEWPREFGGDGDTVKGWLTPNDLVPVILWVAMQPSKKDAA